MGRSRRRRIAWVWSISYTFASLCVAGAVWAHLSFLLAQADASASLPLVARPEARPSQAPTRLILALGVRALAFVLVLAVPGFEMNQQLWAALRSRPRRVRGVRLYAWKLLVLNLAILLAAPLGASLQFYLGL